MADDTDPGSSDGWFVRYPAPDGDITTLWEFDIGGLTEEQALEIDRRIRAAVADARGEQSGGDA